MCGCPFRAASLTAQQANSYAGADHRTASSGQANFTQGRQQSLLQPILAPGNTEPTVNSAIYEGSPSIDMWSETPNSLGAASPGGKARRVDGGHLTSSDRCGIILMYDLEPVH
jgi:hypothetical protein